MSLFMRNDAGLEYLLNEEGSKVLRRYTDVGSYAMAYLLKNGDVVCPDVADELFNSDEESPIQEAFVVWDGAMYCDVSGCRLEVAYPDPDEEE
jgi:hypothetical protein